MKFYHELQLNQIGSKKIIKESETLKQKLYHLIVYLFKILLTVGFCFLFVTIYSLLFSNENSIIGVVVLLYLLVFRNAHFMIKTNQSLFLFILFFAIMAVMPQIASHAHPLIGLIINLLSISTFVFLGCHEPGFYNQSTLVLCYLLIYGYPVEGVLYEKRVLGLIVGCIIVSTIFYIKNRHQQHPETISSIIKAFDIHNPRTQWQLCQVIGVSLVVFVLECLGIKRSMWGGIAAMSVILPAMPQMKKRVVGRVVGNIAGVMIFVILYYTLPHSIYTYIGILGGIGVGLSATYSWQAIFNTFGALAIASELYGLSHALSLRIATNVFAVIFALLFCVIFYKFIASSKRSI